MTKKILEQGRKNSISAAGIYAPNAASTARNDLSHLICFNSDKKGQDIKEQKQLRRLVTVLATSALMKLTWTVLQRLP